MSMTSNTDIILQPCQDKCQTDPSQVEGSCLGNFCRSGPGDSNPRAGPGKHEGISRGTGELAVSGCAEATGEATSSPMPQGISSFFKPFFLKRIRYFLECYNLGFSMSETIRLYRDQYPRGQGLRASLSSGGGVVGTARGGPGVLSLLSQKGVQETESPPYLESIAKRSVNLDSIFKTKCPGYFIQGSCENGHRYAKELYCGRDWCPVCGMEWSAVHQRRFSRWLSKAFQISSMGYFVFTIPEELRSNFRTKTALSRLGHQVQEMLKSYGYSRGLRRYHFFGDKSIKWNPHLNVLVDGGYISPGKMDRIKSAYAGILGCSVVDVNYRFRRSPGEKVHSLKYITRATFLDYSWDPVMALELRGFRNQLWWGSRLWDQEPVWSLDDLQGLVKQDLDGIDVQAVESLENGGCPKCGLPLDWGKVQTIAVLEDMKDRRSLGAGYWELPAVRPPPARLEFQNLDSIEYWLKVCRVAGIQVKRVF